MTLIRFGSKLTVDVWSVYSIVSHDFTAGRLSPVGPCERLLSVWSEVGSKVGGKYNSVSCLFLFFLHFEWRGKLKGWSSIPRGLCQRWSKGCLQPLLNTKVGLWALQQRIIIIRVFLSSVSACQANNNKPVTDQRKLYRDWNVFGGPTV